MYAYAIPIAEHLADRRAPAQQVGDDRLILYRPLLQTAFVGNQAMVELVFELLDRGGDPPPDTPRDVLAFLETVGFLRPDPAPPQPPPDGELRPSTAVLLLTNRCNLRCTYCYASGGEGPLQTLSLDSACAAIDYVCRSAAGQEYPYFDLTFHGGGEPVQAWETLTAAAAYVRTKDVPHQISMVSNGVWSARQRAWILDNLDNLSISFDGRPETQNRQRSLESGQGSFRAVMRTLAALDQAGFEYGIRMTATPPWQERLPEDVRFICQETGCRVLQVEPAFNARRGEHGVPTPEQARDFCDGFMAAFEIASQAGRQLTYSGARPWLLTQTFCTAPYEALIVNADGNLVACYEIANKHHALAQMSTLGRIVDGQVIVDQRARDALHAYMDRKRAACRDCFCYWHCAGDCYARSFVSAEGEIKAVGPRCAINRAITVRILLWYIMAGDGLWRGEGASQQETELMRAF